MKALVITGVLLGLGGGCAPAPMQPLGLTRGDHDVQKLWDDIFDPRTQGSDRTNWERQREAERREWCRANTGYPRCSVYR